MLLMFLGSPTGSPTMSEKTAAKLVQRGLPRPNSALLAVMVARMVLLRVSQLPAINAMIPLLAIKCDA
eukprot:11194413-Lingulodinium_polyedra.AAC.1